MFISMLSIITICSRNAVEVFQKHFNVVSTKRLVIFNPAVGGWSTCEGGQNPLKTCLRGVEKL